jgi:CDP-diacylglycerol--serine O-phosphatidyltransferase
VVFATICDYLDGKVARASKSQSLFGKELDSLADAVSFGVVPAYLVYVTNFNTVGIWGVVLCFAYVFAGVFRLARYNVQTASTKSRVFKGLPIPVAALSVVTYMIMSNYYWETMSMPRVLMFLVPGVSALMVSTIPYESLPSVLLRRGIRKNVMLLYYAAGLVFTIINPQKWMFPWVSGYIFLYLFRGIMRKLRQSKKEIELFDERTPI